MLKISEFAKLANTTRRTLIFYDEKDLFKPIKVDKNGYRFYSPDQLYQFELISGLRQLDLSINDIKEILTTKEDDLEQYLTRYQIIIKQTIDYLQKLNSMLDIRKNNNDYNNVPMDRVVVLPNPTQEFWCTDLKVDCTPSDIAILYSEFMENLGTDINSIPSKLGFLTSLSLQDYSKYMSSSFRIIKEINNDTDSNIVTKISKPKGNYIAIKVDNTLDSILSGLKKLHDYVQQHNMLVDDFLWQINTDYVLVSSASSAQQILQYQILEVNNDITV